MNEIQPSAHGYEIKAALDAQGAAGVADLCPENTGDDTRGADVVQRIDDLNADMTELKGQLDRFHRQAQRPLLRGNDARQYSFVNGYLRKGFDAGLAGYEAKSINFTNPGDGGFALPKQIDDAIEAKLRDISPIRAVATVVKTSSADYRKLVATNGISSGWVNETAARPDTPTNTFVEIQVPTGELYANPSATQAMLDDAAFDVTQWLTNEIAIEFAQKEGAAFISGTGVQRPKGFLVNPTAATADTVRAFGTLQYLPSGAAGAFISTNPHDKIVDLVHTLRPAFRQGAVFVMNSKTLSVVRKFKDSTGQFLWQPGLGDARPATLLGYQVIEAEDMPDIATDSMSIAFGNFQHGYVIADRTDVRVLRDPFSNKPFVNFYATKRVGGSVVNSEAIKLMKFNIS
jgi:HK97 family phage major capsid protein